MLKSPPYMLIFETIAIFV